MIKHIHTHNDECARGVGGEQRGRKKSEKGREALLMRAHTLT